MKTINRMSWYLCLEISQFEVLCKYVHISDDNAVSLGGGGAKEYVSARTHITSARIVLMLSRAIWALFLSILIIKIWD